ncbi:dihydroorotase [Capnocytophaga sp. oral taxon 338]|uniref:dihydroorotase n=1 Tax=Capnocytophaga sp. oral taxon 338 TaxID=710239 RepID=UPI000202C63C|nr:dihydroorotase [Capnocytophaga sp. oral taxon 338]EGD33531.1 dihydroorotase [Capnocytophaga sp. oral taxon 338 str. F0234]
MKTLLKNGKLISDNHIQEADLLIENERIAKIASAISAKEAQRVIDLAGMLVFPGVIDDQVHFREPGLTHKATIASESIAAVAGGTTTFFDQPNTIPQATTIDALEDKFAIAASSSVANFSFLLGGTNDNIEELKRINPKNTAGVKLFLGSSTGNMLVDNEKTIERIFKNVPTLIAAHCEDEQTIKRNLEHYLSLYGAQIPIECHPLIRSAEACYLSSSRAIALAKQTGARLHVFHLSTAKETELLDNTIPLSQKKITAEACIHHLWFSDKDYDQKGVFIKWNPAVKSQADREGIWKALLDNRIDVIATDHAPHTLEEKSQKEYQRIPSGAPLVQHSLVAALTMFRKRGIPLERLVEKMCHNPAILFRIRERGYLREGYYADITCVAEHTPWQVSKENILYKCGWSPLEGTIFDYKVAYTFVNGNLVYDQGTLLTQEKGKRVLFDN